MHVTVYILLKIQQFKLIFFSMKTGKYFYPAAIIESQERIQFFYIKL